MTRGSSLRLGDRRLLPREVSEHHSGTALESPRLDDLADLSEKNSSTAIAATPDSLNDHPSVNLKRKRSLPPTMIDDDDDEVQPKPFSAGMINPNHKVILGKRKLMVEDPWDLKRGAQYNVFTNRRDLNMRVKRSKVGHFAPNCVTFTRAREIPIPGVLRP